MEMVSSYVFKQLRGIRPDIKGLEKTLKSVSPSVRPRFKSERWLQLFQVDPSRVFIFTQNTEHLLNLMAIPWRDVYSWIKDISDGVIINPEVHHRKQVHETIQFCEEMMEEGRPTNESNLYNVCAPRRSLC